LCPFPLFAGNQSTPRGLSVFELIRGPDELTLDYVPKILPNAQVGQSPAIHYQPHHQRYPAIPGIETLPYAGGPQHTPESLFFDTASACIAGSGRWDGEALYLHKQWRVCIAGSFKSADAEHSRQVSNLYLINRIRELIYKTVFIKIIGRPFDSAQGSPF
jgi:hypothetical protein